MKTCNSRVQLKMVGGILSIILKIPKLTYVWVKRHEVLCPSDSYHGAI